MPGKYRNRSKRRAKEDSWDPTKTSAAVLTHTVDISTICDPSNEKNGEGGVKIKSGIHRSPDSQLEAEPSSDKIVAWSRKEMWLYVASFIGIVMLICRSFHFR